MRFTSFCKYLDRWTRKESWYIQYLDDSKQKKCKFLQVYDVSELVRIISGLMTNFGHSTGMQVI